MAYRYLPPLIRLAVLMLIPLLPGLPPAALAADEGDKQRQTETFLSELLPLAPDVERTIQNPYHAAPAWKLWAQDDSPVDLDLPGGVRRFQLPPKSDRMIPVFSPQPGSPVRFEPASNAGSAGFYDDVYLSLDNGHTRLRFPKPEYFINGPSLPHELDFQSRFKLGATFTSQSYAERGRAIVDDTANNLLTEKYFFFANTVRATPAHRSYRDTGEQAVYDDYDGLHAHSFHSLGQSGSELHGLSKMMIAGASMPRATKDLLKYHGAYAIALLTIFKAALPYADEHGKPLPYEHELRHRPVYSANGDPFHKHYGTANLYYHGYDDASHLWEMAAMARSMDLAPPVAILGIAGIRVRTSERVFLEHEELRQRIKSANITAIRIWGEPGETIEAIADLRTSYDLQAEKLSYQCQGVYLNQRNVSVSQLEPGVFSIRVAHDSTLPKGRIPVICTARNSGAVPSNPVFLNFYWPEEDELADYGSRSSAKTQKQQSPLKKRAVTVNKRPLVSQQNSVESIPCMPGDSVSYKWDVTDPEGFPVKIYRRPDEWGSVEGTTYSVDIPENAVPQIKPVHVVFSDGTGGYSSRMVQLCIGKKPDRLNAPWESSLFGSRFLQSTVTMQDNQMVFQGGEQAKQKTNEIEGLFVFRLLAAAEADMMVRITEQEHSFSLGLLLTNTLDQSSRNVFLGFLNGEPLAMLKPKDGKSRIETVHIKREWESANIKYVRIINRSGTAILLASEDGYHWRQVAEKPLDWFKTIYAGLLYRGSHGQAAGQVVEEAPALATVSAGKALKSKEGSYTVPLKILAAIPKGYTARYTTDGSTPNAASLPLGKDFTLAAPGEYLVRVMTFKDDMSTGMVSTKFKVDK